MQARKLKNLLKTTYIIQEIDDNVCIGSGYIHDIIKINKFTFKMTGDTRGYEELNRIYKECEKLIENGTMKSIVDCNEDITDMQKIYIWSSSDGLIETYTDDPRWPNTDYTGRLLYENTTFTDKHKAIDYAIKELYSSIEIWNERLQESVEDVQRIQTRLKDSSRLLFKLLNDRKELEDVECQCNKYA